MVAPLISMPNTVKHSGISGIPTQLMVLHSGESPLRGGYAQSLTNWANVPEAQGGPQASWHWFVDPIAIVSMVDPNYAAWHASEANPLSEGFEQAGYARFSAAEWVTPKGLKQLENLAWIMAQRALVNGIPPVWLTTGEVEAVTHRGNRSIKGFCIHAQIDPDMRTDPGQNYPYDQLMNRIKHHMGASSVAPPAAPVAAPEKEWDEMASVEEIRKVVREEAGNFWFTNAYGTPVQLWSILSAIDKHINGNNESRVRQGNEVLAQVAGLKAAVEALSAGGDLTAEQITKAAQEGAARALAQGVELEADVTIKQKEA
jgi:outer membrane murein-binding lipoprotein Lpp